MKFPPLLTPVITALALLTGAHAWGVDGHAIVATIAESRLEPNVLPTLCSILELSAEEGNCSLASVASWADGLKSIPRWSWSKELHFANAVEDNPPERCPFPGEKGWIGGEDRNVLAGIRNTTNLLDQWVQQGKDLSNPVASEALKFLIHFAGDMHMPFHLTGRERGANSVNVMWGGKEVRLHVMWDEDVVQRAIDTTPSRWNQPLSPETEVEQHLHGNEYDPLVRRILVEGINKIWADEVGSWAECGTAGASQLSNDDQAVLQSQRKASDKDDDYVCPLRWASPIHELLCDWVWPKRLEEPPYSERNGTLLELDTEEYAGRITQELLAEKLLAKGGVRLASILNLIFAQPYQH